MMNYNQKDTMFTEQLACNLLNSIDIQCELNNLTNKTDVDIKTKNGIKIDVQFSKNFERYGDYRLDIISAYFPRKTSISTHYIYDENIGFKQNFEKKYECQVVKLGKIFQGGYLDALVILFYHGKIIDRNKNHGNPDKILVIKKSDLISYLGNNKVSLFNAIKLNNKFDLDDQHGSAFIPIKVSQLVEKSPCFFGTLDEFYDKQSIINELLSPDRTI